MPCSRASPSGCPRRESDDVVGEFVHPPEASLRRAARSPSARAAPAIVDAERGERRRQAQAGHDKAFMALVPSLVCYLFDDEIVGIVHSDTHAYRTTRFARTHPGAHRGRRAAALGRSRGRRHSSRRSTRRAARPPAAGEAVRRRGRDPVPPVRMAEQLPDQIHRLIPVHRHVGRDGDRLRRDRQQRLGAQWAQPPQRGAQPGVARSGRVVGHSVRHVQLRGTARRFSTASATRRWHEGGRSSS